MLLLVLDTVTVLALSKLNDEWLAIKCSAKRASALISLAERNRIQTHVSVY